MSKLVQNYLLQQTIGKGVYGQVFRAIHQKTKQLFAVKVIPKSSFRSNPKLEQLAINQINILSSLKHQNIVRFVQTLKTPNNFYFVYQFCNQGTLENQIQKKKFLKENQALIIFKQLLEAFKQLNKNNIMHRDLKPDNIFMSNGKVKLGDFGFCKMLEVNMAQTMLGSPIYMAPEILRQEIYTSKADIWSLGVVLFELLFGYCPFQSSNISQLIIVLKQSDLIIPKQINPISQKAQALLKKMLVKDQFKRIQWVDLFDYKIDDYGNILSGYNKELGIEALQKYFLNDVKSAGEIVFDQNYSNNATSVNTYQNMEFKSEEIGSEKFSSNGGIGRRQQSISKIQQSNRKKQQSNITSLKKVVSQFEPTNINNPLLRSQSLGRAGPGPSGISVEVNQFKLSNNGNINNAKHSQLNNYENISLQKRKQQNNLTTNTSTNKPSQQHTSSPSFLQKHSSWSQAIDIISQLSQKTTIQNDKCIYWIARSLIDRLNTQYSGYPQWTDVIMQQKQQINAIIKQLEHIEINKDGDKKNQILKLWSKANLKGDVAWSKAVRFIFNEESTNKSIQEILLN